MITKKYYLFFIYLVLVLILIIGIKIYTNFNSFVNHHLKENIFFPSVFLDGMDLSGIKRTSVENYFKEKEQKVKNINFILTINEQIQASLSATDIDLVFDYKNSINSAFNIGRDIDKKRRIINQILGYFRLKKHYFSTKISYNQAKINQLVYELEIRNNRPAKNALFDFVDGRVKGLKKEEPGFELETANFLKNFRKTLEEIKINPPKNNYLTLKINGRVIPPEITLAQASNFRIEEEIGEGQSNFADSSPERIHNILIATSKISGLMIPPKGVFSFNENLGKITINEGYKRAYIIKNGQTVLDDGGGICQVSTTIFRAAMNSALPILERHAHAYRVSYYEKDTKPGFDATVYSPLLDLKFLNDTPSYILIIAEIDRINSILKIKFYGKKDGRISKISNYRLWDLEPPPPPFYQETHLLKRGQIKQVDFPAWGAKVIYTYQIYHDEKIIFEKKFFSNYKPWKAVYLVGTLE